MMAIEMNKEDFTNRLKKLIEITDLNEWTKDFLESISDYYKRKGSISEKQMKVFEKIECQHSDEARARREAWHDSYNDEMRDIAKVCANYYLKSGYFVNLATSVIEDDDFIPSEKAWKAMCSNKYAMKVRDAAFGIPKFAVGSMIMVRKSTPGGGATLEHHRYKVGTDLAIVISNDEPVVSACRGNRAYKIVFVGDSTAQFAEERDLRQLPKKLSNLKK